MKELEHPDITHTLRTGYPRKESKLPRCPVCGEVCETIYWSKFGEVVGCDECIVLQEAWDFAKDYID